MTIDEAIKEWKEKKRRMGCVSATQWLVDRCQSFKAERLTRFTEDREVFEHVIATDGVIRIDLAPYSDAPEIDVLPDSFDCFAKANQKGALL